MPRRAHPRQRYADNVGGRGSHDDQYRERYQYRDENRPGAMRCDARDDVSDSVVNRLKVLIGFRRVRRARDGKT